LFGENFDSDMQKIFLKKLTSALEKKMTTKSQTEFDS